MSIKNTVLLIEDEEYIARVIETVLRANGYRVITAHSGAIANSLIPSHIPDLVLLDLGLPDLDGIDILKSLRYWSDIPVIVISARDMDKDKVEALDLGADDYITKPFSTPELLARIRVALRHRETKHSQNDSYTVGGFHIDFVKRRVTVDGELIHLTQIEYRIVELVARQPGVVLTYDSIIKEIWGPNSPSDNNRILRVNMFNIRRKIEKNNISTRYILTEIGVGYRMAEQ
ncbi:MAG TPA: response regulator transcription factor [Bacillota bacterium]|jgi:two-component system KDP operon response regulator KdpE|nr:response regulator transcription factor [Fastidiosipila sp.]HPX93595.1 response regulator transcription factor [Bacillota bacterium]HQB80570.1 response regulator transcription factor [Bacillota bacterium]